jgi:hypothetical protein
MHARSFVGGLSGLHTFFASRNTTTYEHFRSRRGSDDNPYDLGCLANWRQVSAALPACCLPVHLPLRCLKDLEATKQQVHWVAPLSHRSSRQALLSARRSAARSSQSATRRGCLLW